ncbi:phenylalanine--tRNA ligase subunit alpha [Mycoplasma wenyonii]|uniref:Phenylalanine--tRNA ligase subunit alpha n=1 Tax=Mycoplasma wenyonii TaxID=65123 RepID=A0A328PQ84_9MOLU|nr:phenylalanine--tRNA ligase subunit alpha [Mycoplasma wenyonii]RAO95108.1 phenylalanine--tRNA ligase subunit alpha [Mycoplasma wenyonii]
MIDQTSFKELERLIKESSSREELDSVFKNWRAQHTLPIREKIKQESSTEEKKRLGLLLKTLTEQSQKMYETRKLDFSSWNTPFYEARELESQAETISPNYSSKNLLTKVFESVYNFLETNNFYFYEESEIVKVRENFDSLLIPETHPARAESDSYFLSNIESEKTAIFPRFNKYRFLKSSSESLMLRTHTTTSTLKLLRKYKGKKFLGASMGNVYRKEDNDSTHLSQFNQLDLVWVDKRLDIANLRELIENLLISLLFEKDSEIKNHYRLRPSYFPFTSPSYEVDLECNCKKAKDCCLCKGTGWIELLGCGFLRQEILEKTHSNCVAIALGIGIERLTILKYGVKDVRELYRNNFSNLVVSAVS